MFVIILINSKNDLLWQKNGILCSQNQLNNCPISFLRFLMSMLLYAVRLEQHQLLNSRLTWFIFHLIWVKKIASSCFAVRYSIWSSCIFSENLTSFILLWYVFMSANGLSMDRHMLCGSFIGEILQCS